MADDIIISPLFFNMFSYLVVVFVVSFKEN